MLLTQFSSTTAAGGLVVLDDNGTSDQSDDLLTYTPPPGFTGVDSFSYKIHDGLGGTDLGTVFITVG